MVAIAAPLFYLHIWSIIHPLLDTHKLSLSAAVAALATHESVHTVSAASSTADIREGTAGPAKSFSRNEVLKKFARDSHLEGARISIESEGR